MTTVLFAGAPYPPPAGYAVPAQGHYPAPAVVMQPGHMAVHGGHGYPDGKHGKKHGKKFKGKKRVKRFKKGKGSYGYGGHKGHKRKK